MAKSVKPASARPVNLLLVVGADGPSLLGTGSKVSNLTGHRFVDWMPSQLKLCYSDIPKCFKKNWAYSRDTRSGVFKPVQFADWAASIVPVLKSEKKSCSENFW